MASVTQVVRRRNNRQERRATRQKRRRIWITLVSVGLLVLVVLPGGATVVAVSFDETDPYTREVPPDHGLYLDDRWQPPWPHEHIDWRNFGAPDDPASLAAALRALQARARDGERVEIGCYGGHGRTGTALAWLAVLEGHPREDAVAWVRANYCTEAVETAEQEAFVADGRLAARYTMRAEHRRLGVVETEVFMLGELDESGRPRRIEQITRNPAPPAPTPPPARPPRAGGGGRTTPRPPRTRPLPPRAPPRAPGWPAAAASTSSRPTTSAPRGRRACRGAG